MTIHIRHCEESKDDEAIVSHGIPAKAGIHKNVDFFIYLHKPK